MYVFEIKNRRMSTVTGCLEKYSVKLCHGLSGLEHQKVYLDHYCAAFLVGPYIQPQ